MDENIDLKDIIETILHIPEPKEEVIMIENRTTLAKHQFDYDEDLKPLTKTGDPTFLQSNRFQVPEYRESVFLESEGLDPNIVMYSGAGFRKFARWKLIRHGYGAFEIKQTWGGEERKPGEYAYSNFFQDQRKPKGESSYLLWNLYKQVMEPSSPKQQDWIDRMEMIAQVREQSFENALEFYKKLKWITSKNYGKTYGERKEYVRGVSEMMERSEEYVNISLINGHISGGHRNYLLQRIKEIQQYIRVITPYLNTKEDELEFSAQDDFGDRTGADIVDPLQPLGIPLRDTAEREIYIVASLITKVDKLFQSRLEDKKDFDLDGYYFSTIDNKLYPTIAETERLRAYFKKTGGNDDMIEQLHAGIAKKTREIKEYKEEIEKYEQMRLMDKPIIVKDYDSDLKTSE